MKLFFAGGTSLLTYPNLTLPDNILESYFYIKNDIDALKKVREKVKFISIDSGGFTARMKGIDIDVREYANWLIKTKGLWDYAYNLDIKDKETTQRNLEYLESRGLNITPVWNPLWGNDYLDYLVSKYPYIAVGNVTGGEGDIRGRRIAVIKNLLRFPNTKFHLFGVTDPQICRLFKEKIYSVDSTSWNAGSQWGMFYYYTHGQLKSYSRRQFTAKFGKQFGLMRGIHTTSWNYPQWKAFADWLDK